MAMSSLTDKRIYVDNWSSRNGRGICKITPHHMAGNLSIETCGNVLQNNGVSSNYGIGTDGRIACYVDEDCRSWASASYDNDSQAITIEVANDEIGGNWHVSDEAFNSLLDLCEDICRRYNFRLTYDGTPNGSLTRHNMFIATTCPGPYLQSRFDDIVRIVNERLDGDTPTPEPTKSIDELANEVIAGLWGNGQERADRLRAAGYDYEAVQNRVNEILEGGSSSEEYYTIEFGDTLSEIAERFGTTVSQLCAWNGIQNPDLIYAGDTIRVR